MGRVILIYGAIAGAIVTAIMLLSIGNGVHSVVLGYLSMLVALSMVFVGVRQYRDKALGGTIHFSPALGLGLAISGVAGICYAAAWEIAQMFMKFDFADFYANLMAQNVRTAGGSPDEVAAASQRAADFLTLYSNPLFRVPMTFLEIFPVGVMVSLLSAALLRGRK